METATQNDAELAAATLSGNRDAFGQIVARYQSLVCALAYSATGSLSQSEDLAQETFFTAWKATAQFALLVAVAVALLWRAVPRTFSVCAALVMVGIGILLCFITPWHARTISGAEVRTVLTEGRETRFEVMQFKNG